VPNQCRFLFHAIAFAAVLAVGMMMDVPKAEACSPESNIGSLCRTAGTYCPQGTLPADGRLLRASDNQALTSLLLGAYGGDGKTTFTLPNLNTPENLHRGIRTCVVTEGTYPRRS